jgi:HEAT repeat protein
MKTRMFSLLVGISIAAGNFQSRAQSDSEPIFEGRRLTEWIVSFDKGTPRPQRDEASRAVLAMGQKGVGHLIGMLTNTVDRSSTITANTQQWRAIHALIYLGPEAAAAIPTLIRCLDDSNEEIQIQVVVALAQIGKQPELVVPALEKLLKSASSRVRKYAVMSISGGFKSSALARAALEKALSNQDEQVREMASRALAGDNPDPGATQ